MATSFGLLSRLDFLQNWASALIAGVNPAIIHNIEKYVALKKVFYLSAIEDIEGDYLEFGVFTGSSFCHAMRCCRKLVRLNPKVSETRFFGFDSFAGFGELTKTDAHPFYTDQNFSTSLEGVKRRAQRTAGKLTFRLVPGFFSESLRGGPLRLGIKLARIVFIDSDTHSSAQDALQFCIPIVQQGTIIVLDDYFSYRGSKDRGVARAFSDFTQHAGIKVRRVLTYGMGGAVYIVSETSS